MRPSVGTDSSLSETSYAMRNDSVAVVNALLVVLLFLPASLSAQGKKPAKSKIPRLKSMRNVAIAKVKRDAKAVAQSAARIDALVEKNYQKYEVTAHPLTTDAQFVRRIDGCVELTIACFKRSFYRIYIAMILMYMSAENAIQLIKFPGIYHLGIKPQPIYTFSAGLFTYAAIIITCI